MRADTLMALYAVVALGDLGIIVHIYFSDTDVLLLTLRRVPELKTIVALDSSYFKTYKNDSESKFLYRLMPKI